MKISNNTNSTHNIRFEDRKMSAFNSNPFQLPNQEESRKFYSKWSIAVKHFAYRRVNDQSSVERAFTSMEAQLRKLFNENRPGTITAASRMLVCNN